MTQKLLGQIKRMPVRFDSLTRGNYAVKKLNKAERSPLRARECYK